MNDSSTIDDLNKSIDDLKRSGFKKSNEADINKVIKIADKYATKEIVFGKAGKVEGIHRRLVEKSNALTDLLHGHGADNNQIKEKTDTLEKVTLSFKNMLSYVYFIETVIESKVPLLCVSPKLVVSVKLSPRHRRSKPKDIVARIISWAPGDEPVQIVLNSYLDVVVTASFTGQIKYPVLKSDVSGTLVSAWSAEGGEGRVYDSPDSLLHAIYSGRCDPKITIRTVSVSVNDSIADISNSLVGSKNTSLCHAYNEKLIGESLAQGGGITRIPQEWGADCGGSMDCRWQTPLFFRVISDTKEEGKDKEADQGDSLDIVSWVSDIESITKFDATKIVYQIKRKLVSAKKSINFFVSASEKTKKSLSESFLEALKGNRSIQAEESGLGIRITYSDKKSSKPESENIISLCSEILCTGAENTFKDDHVPVANLTLKTTKVEVAKTDRAQSIELKDIEDLSFEVMESPATKTKQKECHLVESDLIGTGDCFLGGLENFIKQVNDSEHDVNERVQDDEFKSKVEEAKKQVLDDIDELDVILSSRLSDINGLNEKSSIDELLGKSVYRNKTGKFNIERGRFDQHYSNHCSSKKHTADEEVKYSLEMMLKHCGVNVVSSEEMRSAGYGEWIHSVKKFRSVAFTSMILFGFFVSVFASVGYVGELLLGFWRVD